MYCWVFFLWILMYCWVLFLHSKIPQQEYKCKDVCPSVSPSTIRILWWSKKYWKYFYETWYKDRWQSGNYALPVMNMWLLWQQIDKYNNICDYSKSTVNIFMKLKFRIDGSMEIMHINLILTKGSILRVFPLAKRLLPRQDFWFKFLHFFTISSLFNS
jgi:hypothetical protein